MLDHLEPWQRTFLVTYGVLAGFCFIVVACRIYVRAIRLKAFKLDDWIMVLALTMNVFGLLCFTMAVRWGQGKAEFVWSIPVIQWNLGYQVLNIMTLSVAKLSIGFHLLRLTEGLYFKRFLWALNIFLFLLTIWAVMMPLLECVPMKAIWDISLRPPQGPAKCLSNKTYTSINLSVVSLIMATDIILALLPIPIVWRLPIRIRERILLAIILGLGFFACFAGILKMYYAVHALEAGAYTTLMKFLVWQIVEPNIAIIAASLPTLRPLVRSLLSCLPSQPDSGPVTQPSSDTNTLADSPDKRPSSEDEKERNVHVGYLDSASARHGLSNMGTHGLSK